MALSSLVTMHYVRPVHRHAGRRRGVWIPEKPNKEIIGIAQFQTTGVSQWLDSSPVY
jgi:hypothetical protein